MRTRSEEYMLRKAVRRIAGRQEMEYWGIDGEGQGREDHKYVFLAACNEAGTNRQSITNKEGLSTIECFELILNIPAKMLFAYFFGYDLTKILKDLPNKHLYFLFRPELRKRKGNDARGPWPIPWKGYRINLQGSKFTLHTKTRRKVIWDIGKFFQGKFVDALRLWKVGGSDLWNRMQYMKDHRNEFDNFELQDVRDYCFEECQCMAGLAHKLVRAHQDAGLKLTSFYGAGSSAKAMLDKMGIRRALKSPPLEMRKAIAQAFIGGRFENSCIGEIYDTIYEKDISSAYPYQLCFLPCLLHTVWERTTREADIEKAETCLVRYKLFDSGITSWGPFPYRDQDGSICYPSESAGGYVWGDEFKAGRVAFPGVKFIDAWIGHKNCNCQPFKDIPNYYLQRLLIGKEGPGIVIKLGLNSCYGKLAQSIGLALFNNWLWSGMITSGCRAQFLQLFPLHRDYANILGVATDGAMTREDIQTPKPKDTGTWEAIDEKGKTVYKPLGGWESKPPITKGLFLARPGISLSGNDIEEWMAIDTKKPKEVKSVRARGIGKNVLLANHVEIIDAYRKTGIGELVRISNYSRFCGAKSSISRAGGPIAIIHGKLTDPGRYKRANGKGGAPSYGQWITRPIEMSFNPMPKRECVNPDGTLKLRKMSMDIESMPYRKAMRDPDREMVDNLREESLEQPDGELLQYG
jgi:hypothetical protein